MAETRAVKRLLKSFESIKTQIFAFNKDTPIYEIKTSLSMLADEWKEFQTLEKTVKGKFDETNLDAVDKIESSHFELKQSLTRWQKIHEEENAQQQSNQTMDELLLNQSHFIQEISSINKKESEVRLPRVNIPIFSGNYSEFPSFRDLFEAAIHNKDNISKVHKLQYLKGLLKGEAYALINHITVTEANYDEAWDKVKNRYDKRKHVVHTLLKQFMEQPIVKQSCANSLRHLADVSDEVMRGLKVLGEQAERRDPWLIYILVNKMDDDTREAWAHKTAEIDFPTLDQLFQFLNKRSDALESLNSIQKTKPNTVKRFSSLVSQSFVKPVCPFCSAEHYLGRCDKFMELPSSARKQLVVDKKLCFNCLSSTHQSTVCRSRYNCIICRRRHHVTLHPETTTAMNSTNTSEDAKPDTENATTSYNTILKARKTQMETSQAILPTASILVMDKFGQLHRCRALLDSGSQSSFVSENCMQRLQLQRQRANVNITGITAGSMISRGKTCLLMTSLYDPNIQFEVDALIINQLPSRLPRYHIDTEDVVLFQNIQLADPDFDKPAPIDILLGADKFFAILENGQRRLNSSILQKTIFGWVVSGHPKLGKGDNASSYMALNVQVDTNIDETLRKFWEIDSISTSDILSPEDAECEKFYDKTYTRQKDGRYVVKLPFKRESSKLGNSLVPATKRFLALERKLSNNTRLREQYNKQIREYITMGHMTEIPQIQHNLDDQHLYYLPHHSVLKESSNTTKVRVVFDGSSKTSTGVSLNNNLMVGPTIQPTLWTTLMRFREHRIAITADVEKMYRQIIVSPDDTDYQRILWRENSSERLRHYKLTRVTFGLSCSAYLAIRTLQQLARDVGDERVLNHILNDFYVDDLLSGSHDLQSAIQLKENISNVLAQGGFLLRKWQSNVKSLCDSASDQLTTELGSDGDASTVMVLGLHWHPSDDVLTFKVLPEQDTEITKRKVISEASRIFDPLGFLSPSVVLLKILFQKLWLTKLDWDDKLPDCFKAEYKRVREEFQHFEKIKIQRFTNHYGETEIHGFADASEVAYCAVVYSKITHENGEVSINILASKTKVAPIKKVSLPRLELCAAHLLAKLMCMIKQTMRSNTRYYAWTDSSIVLAWLSTYPARWKTFVSNRTSQILEKFPRQHWGHVKSADNPADHGSRGVTPKRLLKLDQWWNGPAWLKLSEELWPTTHSESEINKNVVEVELNKTHLPTLTFQSLVQNSEYLYNIIQRKSKLSKIFRVVAYILRFVSNLKNKNPDLRITGELNAKEIELAKTILIKWLQANEFEAELHDLRRNKTVNNNSNLLSLAPFIDGTGVLRVGGRLVNAEADYDSKHPIIIPSNHLFTVRLIWETHNKNLHAGATLTSNLIREKYWIIKGRSKIRSILKNCVTCTKYARRTSMQLMGNLPTERIVPSRPFTNCGIDFAGPLYFASKKGRGGTNPVKGYICIFVCLSVKAIHIEPVSDLTSEAFLAALRRFTARRGIPQKIYTDNGSNFIGAKRIMNEACKLISNVNQNYIISEYLSDNRIDWHFIPPASPHFGGLWESAVKSVKTHLLKSTNNVNLTFEEMATLLSQIENILNSRPLCTTSTDDDYQVLTPAHFLIGSSTGSVPETHITAQDSSLSRWQRIQARIQTFWKKYHTDYLNTLQQRYKWQKPKEDIQVGDIVLIREDNLPVCKWPLGRVLLTHPGDDNLVRVVTIKTSSSTLQRPVVKICKLPVG